MADDPISARAKLEVGIQGIGSQAYVVSMAAIGGVCACLSLFFVWHQHPQMWVPLTMTALFVGLATWKHGKSQRILDLVGAKPTKVSSNEVALELDPATLADPSSVDALERLMANAFHRVRLPAPDGLTGRNFQPDLSPQALEEAMQAVNEINLRCEDAQKRTKEIFQQRAVPEESIAAQPAISAPESVPRLADHLMAEIEDVNVKNADLRAASWPTPGRNPAA